MAASFVEMHILAMLPAYGRFARPTVAGALYLVAASFMGLVSLRWTTSLQKKQTRGTLEPAAWLLYRRAYVLRLSAWEVSIVGLLNIMAFFLSGTRAAILLGYIFSGLFMASAYKMVGLADNRKQDGGAKPLNYFGRPRSRGIFFLAFIYTPVIPLIILSLAWSETNWCPKVLQPPDVWLLLLSLCSAMSAAMAFQRYREALPQKLLARKIFVFALCGLGSVGVVQVISGPDLELYLLSATTLGCTAATAYWLLLAREEGGSLRFEESRGSGGGRQEQ